MARYRRAHTPGATWFLTVVAFDRRPILCEQAFRRALATAVRTVQARHPFRADTWLLLANPLHCIWTLPADDSAFGLRWSAIKRSVSRACGAEYGQPERMTPSKHARREATVWQRRFWEHQIRDDADYGRHMDLRALQPRPPRLVPYASRLAVVVLPPPGPRRCVSARLGGRGRCGVWTRASRDSPTAAFRRGRNALRTRSDVHRIAATLNTAKPRTTAGGTPAPARTRPRRRPCPPSSAPTAPGGCGPAGWPRRGCTRSWP